MNNSFEKLPEEYENDGNTYCHGIVNCKYYHDECVFMYMGSGNPDDMPCRVQEQSVISEFRKWKEEKEREEQNEVKGDLISREALKKAMRKSINERYKYWDKRITVADIATLIFDEIDNAPAVEGPKGEYVKGVVDALDKAFLLFDAKSTYSGERVLQILEKLKWSEKLKDEKGSAEE